MIIFVDFTAVSAVQGTRIAIITAGIIPVIWPLHSRGFMHQGLKPENILFDWNWLVRIEHFSDSVPADELQ
jgi:hypothetical protein